MKRRIFFWLEKLKITPAERKTISGLLVVLVVLVSLNMSLSPSEPFEEGDYLELEKQFEERTVLLKKQEKQLMARYHPPIDTQITVVQNDTVESDSAESETDEKRESTKKQRVNVNKADQETLESLPGIGPAYAGRIIKYRKKHGGFDTLEELKKINGIGEKRLDNLKPFIKLTDSNKSKN
jgi:comEA protein